MFRACFGKPLNTPLGTRLSDSGEPLNSRLPVCQTPEVAATESSNSHPQPLRPTSHVAEENGRRGNSHVGASTSGRPATQADPPARGQSQKSLNASQIQQIDPDNVVYCEARHILDGVCLSTRELGRGTYGAVVQGTYRGVGCAIKVMISQEGLDRAAVRELLLGPSLQHPNIVSTYATRCAQLTHEFFDFLEGGRHEAQAGSAPRMLEPVPLNSGDGFGDPLGSLDGAGDPMMPLHLLLHSLEAKVDQTMVLVLQQFCDRGTLDGAIRGGVFRARPDWPERVALRSLIRTSCEIARGLLHLHDMNVVHGDVKPANVLLCNSQDDRRAFTAKVGDFGLCHVLPHAATSVYTGSWGSIGYMAPEAFDGRVSRATDVWSFGVVLFEMLTGVQPYAGVRQRDIVDVVKAVKDGRLTLRWPDVRPMWQPLVELGRRCLSHSPDQRPIFTRVVEELVAMERGIRAGLAAAAAPAAEVPVAVGSEEDQAGAGGAENSADSAVQDEVPAPE